MTAVNRFIELNAAAATRKLSTGELNGAAVFSGICMILVQCHGLPPQVLGHGASSVESKLSAFLFALLLDSGALLHKCLGTVVACCKPKGHVKAALGIAWGITAPRWKNTLQESGARHCR